jgi:hypothetical protein
MTTPNPFIRGYQDLFIRRELLITYDEHFEPCYRQITAEQQDAADDQLVGHHSVFNETHSLAIEPEEVTIDQHTLYLYRLAIKNGRARNQSRFRLRLNANDEAIFLILSTKELAFSCISLHCTDSRPH